MRARPRRVPILRRTGGPVAAGAALCLVQIIHNLDRRHRYALEYQLRYAIARVHCADRAAAVSQHASGAPTARPIIEAPCAARFLPDAPVKAVDEKLYSTTPTLPR